MQDVRGRRRRPSPSLVISLLALFVALTGTSYAAIVITGKNVKNSSLTGADIKARSIKGRNVAKGTLTAANFAAGVLTPGPQGLQGPEGDTGPKGDTGATGAPGAKGDPGATNVVMRAGGSFSVNGNSFATGTASCQAGERATGGGLYNESNVFVLRMVSSYPTPNPTTPPSTGNGQTPTGWRVWVANESATVYSELQVYVICAAP